MATRPPTQPPEDHYSAVTKVKMTKEIVLSLFSQIYGVDEAGSRRLWTLFIHQIAESGALFASRPRRRVPTKSTQIKPPEITEVFVVRTDDGKIRLIYNNRYYDVVFDEEHSVYNIERAPVPTPKKNPDSPDLVGDLPERVLRLMREGGEDDSE